MKTALSLSDAKEWDDATKFGANFREIRIDLIKDKSSEEELLKLSKKKKDEIPCIATIRSRKEGGDFTGNTYEWRSNIEPWINYVDYIDIERDFSMHAQEIKKSGKKIIASVHLDYMPDLEELTEIEKDLRKYGDIPKIVVTPKKMEDVAIFISFIINIKKPFIASVMGEKFKCARIPLLLFGSMIIYCHSGKKASKGQYHIKDINKILDLI
ncbi:MAG: type I 3-dehydroquinate dehydratase [Methanomicrobiaceae archaeon]|nr:type I 3-dehydroquinate dehydratase [Methanomicrobiaceae archaeon]